MITGNFKAYNQSIANGAKSSIDISSVETEKIVKINSSASGLRVLFTGKTSSATADNSNSYSLPMGETEFELGRGLNRISLYNNTGNTITVSLAILY